MVFVCYSTSDAPGRSGGSAGGSVIHRLSGSNRTTDTRVGNQHASNSGISS